MNSELNIIIHNSKFSILYAALEISFSDMQPAPHAKYVNEQLENVFSLLANLKNIAAGSRASFISLNEISSAA